MGTGTDRCYAHDWLIIILRPAKDVKEALLGGSLASLIFLFKIPTLYLFVFLNYILNSPKFICNYRILEKIYT